jgi:hypothetical protein
MDGTLTIRIRPVDKVLADFRDTFKAVEGGRRVTPRSGRYFTNIEAARNFFTRERLALLRAIRRDRPGSTVSGLYNSARAPGCAGAYFMVELLAQKCVTGRAETYRRVTSFCGEPRPLIPSIDFRTPPSSAVLREKDATAGPRSRIEA